MRQGLQCSEWGKPVPGLEPTKPSEPMWTLFFELHAGPWRTTGHDKRPDTRPIEAPRRNVAEKITLPNRGHPHTPRRDPCHKPESCASPNRSPKRELQPYPDPPSRRLLGAAPASYDAGRRGHPPHQSNARTRYLDCSFEFAPQPTPTARIWLCGPRDGFVTLSNDRGE